MPDFVSIPSHKAELIPVGDGGSGDPDAGPERDWVTAAIGIAAAKLTAVDFGIWREYRRVMVFEAPDRTISRVREL